MRTALRLALLVAMLLAPATAAGDGPLRLVVEPDGTLRLGEVVGRVVLDPGLHARLVGLPEGRLRGRCSVETTVHDAEGVWVAGRLAPPGEPARAFFLRWDARTGHWHAASGGAPDLRARRRVG